VIAIVGQSVIDRIRTPEGRESERLGGSPVFAAAAVHRHGLPATILTRGATPQLRAELERFDVPVVVGPGSRSFISELDLLVGGDRRHRVASLGDPFLPVDIDSWMAATLARCGSVVAGAQWTGDFPPETLAALAAGGRRVFLDAQGLVRPARLGAIELDGPFDVRLVPGVGVLKCAEAEADALFGDAGPSVAIEAGVPVVVLSLGERGAVVFTPQATTPIGVDAVVGLADTVGAGDMFLTLLAAAMADGASPEAATATACDRTAAILRGRVQGGS
jgi:sugar/nucleoside kinase (ribokinase family)